MSYYCRECGYRDDFKISDDSDKNINGELICVKCGNRMNKIRIDYDENSKQNNFWIVEVGRIEKKYEVVKKENYIDAIEKVHKEEEGVIERVFPIRIDKDLYES